MTSLDFQRVEVNIQRIKGRNLTRRRYNALIVISMNIMLLNDGSTKIERERTKSKKQMFLKKIHILMMIWSC